MSESYILSLAGLSIGEFAFLKTPIVLLENLPARLISNHRHNSPRSDNISLFMLVIVNWVSKLASREWVGILIMRVTTI